MNSRAKVIKLKRAKKYPTYQFYAEMDNKNIDLKDGLKIAALTCLSWTRERLKDVGDFEELNMPLESEYRKVSFDDFKSFNIGDSFKIQVISLFDEGKWALKIVENDSGSLEGKPIVPGRTITSDIAFRIVNDKLECGFRVIIKDLMDVEIAESIRYSVIKRLGFNENFGFKQVTSLNKQDRLFIKDKESLKYLKEIIKSKDNQLPVVLYTYEDGLSSIPTVKDLGFTKSHIDFKKLSDDKQKEIVSQSGSKVSEVESKAIPHLNKYFGLGRVYHVPVRLASEIEKIINVPHIKQNKMIVITPGTKEVKRFNYEDEEDKNKAFYYVENYYRKKEYDYHNVIFYDELNEYYQSKQESLIEDEIAGLKNEIDKLNTILSQSNRKERKDNYAPNNNLNKEFENVKGILNKYKEDNITLKKEISHLEDDLGRKNTIIEYYKRKDNYAKIHKEIAKWAEDNLKYVVLNKKAIMCLENNDATKIDADKICEALDYLDNIYSQSVFFNKPDDYLNIISSITYNRPYDVSPSGLKEPCRGECKIKYAFDGEKNKEHILDQHLRVGKHGTNLMRIYFLVDKHRQKIVIGSLPKHL